MGDPLVAVAGNHDFLIGGDDGDLDLAVRFREKDFLAADGGVQFVIDGKAEGFLGRFEDEFAEKWGILAKTGGEDDHVDVAEADIVLTDEIRDRAGEEFHCLPRPLSRRRGCR